MATEALPYTEKQIAAFALEHGCTFPQACAVLGGIIKDRRETAARADAAAKRAALVADAQARHVAAQRARFLAMVREIGADNAAQWLSEAHV